MVEDDRSDVTPPAPVRSMSAVDVRSEPTSEPSEPREPEARSPIEYTDLDVLVSRLEGSGREYEVSPVRPLCLLKLKFMKL